MVENLFDGSEGAGGGAPEEVFGVCEGLGFDVAYLIFERGCGGVRVKGLQARQGRS